jgi:hypothetical protein
MMAVSRGHSMLLKRRRVAGVFNKNHVGCFLAWTQTGFRLTVLHFGHWTWSICLVLRR